MSAPGSTLRSVAEHGAAVLALTAPVPVVRLPLDQAFGLRLAEDQHAQADVPRWDNSAMDGYAVHAADTVGADTVPVRLQVVADLPAGSAEVPTVVPGTAARIMTGAPVPPGADAVVPVEVTDAGTHEVVVSAAARVGAHIRPVGDDVHAGDLVVPAGALLGPRQVAALASVGVVTVPVHRRVVVAVLSTGSELVEPGVEPARGQIPDSNSLLLAGLAAGTGAEVRRIGGVPDDPAALRAVLDGLDGKVDLVVTSGGVSMGAYEVVRDVLEPLPGTAFVTVAMQPGKPQGLGRLPGGTPILSLPGNPVSAFVSFELFVRPAIERLAGGPGAGPELVVATVDDAWSTPAGRAQYMPVVLDGSGAGLRARRAVSGGSGSHLVAGLARADGLAVVPIDVERVRAGDQLRVMRTS